MARVSTECNVLVRRLKQCDLNDILKNPVSMLKFYPVRDPDNELTIFDEVYCLLNDALMTKSFKSRLFLFLNVMLSSTKVPAYMIAAYMKKLSRLTLNAKPRTLVIILRIIGNLLIRHPVLYFLRDRVDSRARELEIESNVCTLRKWFESDPFDADQYQNLKGTRAMDSSLWEIMPLRYHSHSKVAEAAQFLGKSEPPDMEFDLEDLIK